MSLTGTALAQTPVVFQGGAVNNASYRPSLAPGGALARGSIFSLFGNVLATATRVATGTPLPPIWAARR